MMITCILLATGRLERLEESIASFLSQDFAGEKELIIINVLHRQTLVFEHPDVRIYNLKSQTMPMRAKNTAIETARGERIVVWSELDYYLPNFLTQIDA